GISDPQAATEDAKPVIDGQHTIDGSLIDANSPQGEVAHFAFDVIAGNKTPDDVGHHDATCSDASRPTVVVGHRAFALQFVSPEYAIIPASAAFDSQALTIALWVEIVTLPGLASDCLLDQPQTLSLCLTTMGQVTFATTFNGVANSLTIQHGLALDTWYHVAVSLDGQAKKIYINGLVDTSTLAEITPTGSEIYVGAEPNGSGVTGSYANVALDELTFYSRALGASEIQTLANQ
ncbi:MAG TPA: LamG domain-containing protein, partial [Kofleriaceae bacterium]